MPDAFVYPRIRRSDVLSANSYWIEFPDLRVLIDPGALPGQTAELRAALGVREGGRRLPLGVCLTHCHLDHSREAGAWTGDLVRPAWLAAQEGGAAALASGDGRQTVAELYGLEIPHVQTQVPLLAAGDLRAFRPRRIPLAADFEARLEPERRAGAVWQSLTWGGAGRIDIVPCAGHSPDSVCYRIGKLLFMGDLLSASRPLIAGLHGWSAAGLRNSQDGIIRLLEEGEIMWCCPGHGDPLPAEKTLGLLRRQRAATPHGDDIETMDPARLRRAVDLALELADEADEVMAAIAGRLLYVADRLELLDESSLARRCRAAMDMDAVDALLEQFRGLCRALAAGDMVPVAFAVEATGVVEKLRKSFVPEALSAFLPASLVNRGQRLLLDFMAVARGSGNLEEFVPTDIGTLLAEAELAWQASPHLDESIADTVEDPDRFAAELARRIGHPPPARRIPVRFNHASGAPPVLAAAIRFVETLNQFVEWLALAGAVSIGIGHGISASGQFVELRIAGAMPGDSARMRAKFQAFVRRFAWAGFRLEIGPDLFRLGYAGPG